MAKKEEKKRIIAPKPTYTPINSSLNATYTPPKIDTSSNLVVSQRDLAPVQTQSSQPLQVRGALSRNQPEAKPVENPFPLLPTVFDVQQSAKNLLTPQTAVVNPEIRAAAPTLFNADKTLEAFDNMVKTPLGPPAPSGLQRRAEINKQLPGRDIPVIGNVLQGIDKVQELTQPASKVAEQFYTPGAGITAIGAGTQAAGSLLSKLAPKIGMGTGVLPAVGREAFKEAAVGAPLGAGQSLASNPQGGLDEAAKQAMWGSLFGAAGGGLLAGAVKGAGAVATKIGEDAIGNLLQTSKIIQQAAELPTTGPLKFGDNATYVNKVMSDIKPVVFERMTPPLENPNELAKWLKPHLGDVSLNDVRKLSYEDMRQLATDVQSNMDMFTIAKQAAKERGYDLDSLLSGNTPSVSKEVDRLRMGRAAGAIDAPISVRYALSDGTTKKTTPLPDTPPSASGEPKPTGTVIQNRGSLQGNKSTDAEPEIVTAARENADSTPQETPLTRPMVDDATLVSGNTRSTIRSTVEDNSDELGFARTVRTSRNTPPDLSEYLNDKRLTGSRTTDVANLQAAQNMIERNGAEKVADRLINKRGTLNAVENTAAQVLSRYYSETGQLDKAIAIISKTAQSGRELGQAVQALSRWNKLDQEGAILLAERQLNRRTRDTDAWNSLTPDQAKPVQEAAQGIEKVQDVKALAQQVVEMMNNRPKGQPFTDAEKAILQEFNKKITDFDQTVKPLLKRERESRSKTIREIGSIQPKDRTRDQVVSYLDAQADKAREALKRQANVGIISESSNPVVLYSIIGASKVARGAVKFSDWSEAMIRDGIVDRLSETYVRSVNKFRKENGLPTNKELNSLLTKTIKERGIDEETGNSLRAMAAEIGFYADDVKLELTQDLQRALRGIGKSTLGEKLSTLQTSAMLLNVPTFLRNAIGNVEQLFIEKINKIAAVPIDWTVSKLTGERTVRFFPGNQEKFWRNFGTGTKGGWDGTSPTGTLASYNISPNAFGDKNPLKYISKTLGASLQGMDYAGYKVAYGDLVSTYAVNLGKSMGLTNKEISQQMPDLIKQLDDRILEMADQAGLYATYQDETLLSRGAQSVKSGLNAITDAPMRNLRERGIIPESISTEGFGLGDVVLKFAKTPANLVMRGIDYSPLGFVRSILEIAPLIVGKSKNFNQRNFVLSLSRAITGTLGFTGLGYIMANNGILTGAASRDADVRSIQEQAGQGGYKVNLSAMKRWFMSGFDSKEARTLTGDRLIDYAWMQPVAISLGMGVNAAEAVNKPLKAGQERNNFNIAKDAILGGLGTILENPMVTGLQNVSSAAEKLIKNEDFSGFTNMIKGVPASFVPTIAGQVRTGMDNNQRETFDKSLFDAIWNQVQNKTPGLSENLPVSYDSLGNSRERVQGGESNSIGNYLTALLSPAKFTKYEVTPEAKIVLDLFEESKDSSVLPRINQKYITVTDPITKDSRKLDLTPEQFSELQKSTGDMVSKLMLKKSAYFSNPNIKTDVKVKSMLKILTTAGEKARNDLKKELGYKK